MLNIRPPVKRNIFLGVFAALALYAIPFTREILSFILDFEIVNGINVVTVLAIVSFFGLHQIYNRRI